MASSNFEYDAKAHRFRDLRTGKFLSAGTVRELRDEFAAAQKTWAEDLARMVANGDLSVQAWELEMRERVKLVHLTEYVYGRGGRNAITADDKARMADLVKNQHDYLHNFAGDLAAGELSEAQIKSRSQMYFDSATHSYERGRVASFGGLELPVMPADGDTPCLANCKCTWDIKEHDDRWEATWQLHADESCDGCLERADQYNPFVQTKEAS